MGPLLAVAIASAATEPAHRPVTPVLRVFDVDAEADFMAASFDAEPRLRLVDGRGVAIHVELEVGGTIVWIDRSTDNPSSGLTTGAMLMPVGDISTAAARMKRAGAREVGPGWWRDPAGHLWRLRRGGGKPEPALVVDRRAEWAEWARALGGVLVEGHLRFGAGVVGLLAPNDALGLVTPAGATPFRVHLYVPDCAAAFKRAVGAGLRGTTPPALRYWGDRWAMVTDRWGHGWGIGERVETLTESDMQRRLRKRGR